MTHKFFENLTEQSSTMLLKGAGKRTSMVHRNGYLKIGCQNWQNEEERRKDFNLA